jgi:hypothetical protein
MRKQGRLAGQVDAAAVVRAWPETVWRCLVEGCQFPWGPSETGTAPPL